MLNIKGAYVVVGPGLDPLPIILAEKAYLLYQDRIGVAGFDKAFVATFSGPAFHGYIAALPCTPDCMRFIAGSYIYPADVDHQSKVRAVCRAIAERKPLGGDGGTKAKLVPDAPIKPRGDAMRIVSSGDGGGGLTVGDSINF